MKKTEIDAKAPSCPVERLDMPSGTTIAGFAALTINIGKKKEKKNGQNASNGHLGGLGERWVPLAWFIPPELVVLRCPDCGADWILIPTTKVAWCWGCAVKAAFVL